MSGPLPLRPQTDQDQWSFVSGPWLEDDRGVITAPQNLAEEYLAIYTRHAYGDFEAEYEFRWDIGWTDAGFVFRGKDARHYYLVQMPASGQQRRSEHFWAAISKVDGNGVVQMLRMELIHGVTSSMFVWIHARIKVTGNELQLWVNGRPLFVTDDTFAEPGYVGLYTQSGLGESDKSSFRNVCITGESVEAAPWNGAVEPAHHHFVIDPEHGHGCGSIVRASNNDLLVSVHDGVRRSVDNGRTWSNLQPAPTPFGAMHVDKEGNLLAIHTDDKPPFNIYRKVSKDDGKTWSQAVQTGIVEFGPQRPFTELYQSMLLPLRGGSLLLFLWGRTEVSLTVLGGRAHFSSPVPNHINICLRSTDDGQSWNEWVDIDGPPHDDHHWLIHKDRLTEISATQTRDGNVVALTRSNESPLMWETWSADGGRTWTPQARGPFAMYASCSAMCTTSSGYLVIAGRFPALAVQVSRDHGMTWQCYQVDTGIWANGAMIEVEPDVALWAYGGNNQPEELRGQLFRVTADNLEPIAIS